MLNAEIIGHEAQRARLRKLADSGRLANSFLFIGPQGIGKRLVAGEFISRIVCESRPADSFGGCGECARCRLLMSGNYPDFYRVDPRDRESWDVEGIRSLLYRLGLRAYAGGPRAVVVDHAHELNVQSANALLKSLEEPRPDTYFILLAGSQSKVLPTIVSRCQTFFFDLLPAAELFAHLRSMARFADFSDERLRELIEMTDGSLEELEQLSETEALWRDLKSRLLSVARGDRNEALQLAADLSRERAAMRLPLSLIRIFARAALRKEPSCMHWAILLDDAIAAERLIFERNLVPNLVLSTMFSSLACGHSSRAHPLRLEEIAL